jgi:hypothetical protein
MADIELMRKVLDAVWVAGERWQQDTWAQPVQWVEQPEDGIYPACGTAGCFAGWLAILDGFDRYDATNEALVNSQGERLRLWHFGNAYPTSEGEWPAGVQTVATYAAERFGLSFQDAELLCGASNSLTQLEDIIDKLEAEPDDATGT